ncbi:MAG: hypothetical protein A2Y10_14955 [Planctomycetes bacterium GWF2_41_51]|nr:MAG: hypothetical protein A2Y10_14955 [Planctomycetes bacterium GWF2_41_51]HBG28498.1 hypothetical protein [Phycisphaerales bacterium]
MRNCEKLILLMTLIFTATCSAETNWNLQIVNSIGGGISPWLSSEDKVTIEGYILNRSEYMLDGTANYSEGPVGFNGGQWQIYIQGDADTDHAGTAIWMGQNYANLPWAGGVGRYTNEEWIAELDRLNHDPRTGYRFMPGDKVRVTGLTKFYGGKTNINERHDTDPENDLIIELTEPGAGLPAPEIITLDMVKDSENKFIFDQTRQTGCEYYQSRLVRINGVHFVNDANWAPNGQLLITDGTARTFPVLLGIGTGIAVGSNNLSAQFDVIAIFDQEDGSSPNTEGYRLWVTNYDGNGSVLTDGCDLSGVFAAGDINKNCVVNFEDFAMLAADWLKCSNPLLTECQ